MAICICGNDNLGNKNVLLEYLVHYEKSMSERIAVVLFDEDITTFLADYLCVKNSWTNLKLDKVRWNKSEKKYKIPALEAVLNNLSETDVEMYEQDLSDLLERVKIFSKIKTSNYKEILNVVINNTDYEYVFMHNYIRFLASVGTIVEEGLNDIYQLASTLEQEGRRLIFTTFLPSLNFKQREKLKAICVKKFDHVILTLDTRICKFTKEEYENEQCTDISNKNKFLIAYRLKHESKVNIDI